MKKTVSLLFCLALLANPIYSQWHYNLPTPTHGNAAVAINDIIYSFGGDASPATQYFSGLEAYNTQSGTWTSKSPMSFGRQSLGGITVNGKIYAIGGHNINSVPYNEEYNPATNAWVTKTSMPTARSHFGIAVLGDTIYTIGGNASGTLTGLVESYNVTTDKWTTRASLSEGRDVSVTAAINGKIYLIGGLPASNTSNADGKLFEYDPVTDSWLQKTSELTPTVFSAASVIGGKIYVIGGATSFGITRKVQAYDPNTDAWTYVDSLLIGRVSPIAVVVGNRIYVSNGIASPSVAKTDMEYLDFSEQTPQWHYNLPTPTHGNAAVVINDIIYSFGGDASPATQYFSGLEAYNTQSGTWTSKSPMSFGRHSLGGITVDGKIYAIGGHNVNSVPYNEEYNPATNTWVTKTSMPTARSHFGIAVLGDTIYTIGGNASGTFTGIVESYNVTTDKWTTHASLSEGRASSVTAVINGKIYLIGGLPASNTSNTDGKLFEYNPVTDSWLQRTSELTPTNNSAACSIGGKIYVIGGAASFGITRKVQVYDPNTDTWTYGDSLLIGRVSPTAVVVGNRIYISNGIAPPSVAKTDMEYLDLNLTDVADNYSSIPKNYYLIQNYPNPFNPTTTINYSIPKSSFVILKIFDALGREIVTLVNEEKTAGTYHVKFNASKLSSGVYLYRMQAGDFVQTKKLVLLK